MIDYLIREESPRDFQAIYHLVQTAFQTANVKDGAEQDFVDRLRASENYLPELALVAACGDTLIGHIMLTRAEFKAAAGDPPKALLLAPLSVPLEYRNYGVGAALTREALRRAAEMGHDAVFLAGDPAYYGRFGFKRADSFGVTCALPIPPQFLLAAEIRSGSLVEGEVIMQEA